MHVPQHAYRSSPQEAVKDLLGLVEAARVLGLDPLRVLGTAALVRCGCGASGADLAALLGKSERSGRRALHELAQASRTTTSGHLAAVRPHDETDATRPLTGHLASVWPLDVGGPGGSQSVSPSPSVDLTDLEQGKGQDAASGGGGSEEGPEKAGGNFALAAHPPRAANATAASVLEALSLPVDVRRAALRHLSVRWKRYGHAVREPIGWCRTVVTDWLVSRRHATDAQLRAISATVSATGAALSAQQMRAQVKRATGIVPAATAPVAAPRSIEDPPATCRRCGAFTCHPSPGLVACENPACSWTWQGRSRAS